MHLFSVELWQHDALGTHRQGHMQRVDESMHVMQGEHMQASVRSTPLPELHHVIGGGLDVAVRQHYSL